MPHRERRRGRPILFVDLVGFTARSDGADPEDVRRARFGDHDGTHLGAILEVDMKGKQLRRWDADSNGKPFVEASMARGGQAALTSGIDGFAFMKSTQSGWENYPHDRYTTLPETADRMLRLADADSGGGQSVASGGTAATRAAGGS